MTMPRFTIPRVAHCASGELAMPRYTIPRTDCCDGGQLAMTTFQIVLIVEVGIIALAYLVGLFRGRPA